MIDEAGHRHVVKREKIVFGAPVFAPVLHERQFDALETDLRHKTAEIRVRLVKELQRIQKTAVIKAESGKIAQLRSFGKFIEQPVIEPANCEHQRVLPALRLDAADDFRPRLPLPQHGRNHFGRLLQI